MVSSPGEIPGPTFSHWPPTRHILPLSAASSPGGSLGVELALPLPLPLPRPKKPLMAPPRDLLLLELPAALLSGAPEPPGPLGDCFFAFVRPVKHITVSVRIRVRDRLRVKLRTRFRNRTRVRISIKMSMSIRMRVKIRAKIMARIMFRIMFQIILRITATIGIRIMFRKQ